MDECKSTILPSGNNIEPFGFNGSGFYHLSHFNNNIYVSKEDIAKMYDIEFPGEIDQIKQAWHDAIQKLLASEQRITELTSAIPEWKPVSEKLPELIDGKSVQLLVRVNKAMYVCHYFPDKFKTVEWEDPDDYKPEDFLYTTQDETGGVWLNEGFYDMYGCEECGRSWSDPIQATHWMYVPGNNAPLPENEQK